MSKDLYEVYACKYNGEYVYIGSGKSMGDTDIVQVGAVMSMN